MKKLDKLILKAFIGPFLLTFVVVVFILLTQTMIKYFDEFVGKDLGFAVFAELMFYFSMNTTPVALPLAVLLSSLMTFGNMGEHNELTAVKGAGISLLRVLLPIFIFSILLTCVAFWFNNTVVPKANLKAFSLLWDIRQKKPSLSIKEGIFYKDLPGVSIKVNKKLPDKNTMLDMMIYDHQESNGNTRVILADSAKMYTMYDGRYLVFELFDGKSYDDYSPGARNGQKDQFVRNTFKKSKMVFSLASFDMGRTPEELFSNHRIMKNVKELRHISDSLTKQYTFKQKNLLPAITQYYFHHKKASYPSIDTTIKISKGAWLDSLQKAKLSPQIQRDILSRAVNQARNIRSHTQTTAQDLDNTAKESRVFTAERYKRYTQSVACLIMFLIGAPLGSIIKKGGLGVPVLVSIIFFIVFYVLSLLGEKWGKEGIMLVPVGSWGANFILLCAGLFFLSKARTDSRLFEADVYRMAFNRLKEKIKRIRQPKHQPEQIVGV
jgi:lipopolysaccharide export system permease protein